MNKKTPFFRSKDRETNHKNQTIVKNQRQEKNTLLNQEYVITFLHFLNNDKSTRNQRDQIITHIFGSG